MPALFTLQMFERDFATDEKRRPSIERGIRSLKRVDQLVGDLLTFARAAAEPDGDAYAPLGSVIAGVVQDLERQAQVAGCASTCRTFRRATSRVRPGCSRAS